MTANAFPEDRQEALRAGMDDYIAKPVRAAELKQVLARWVVPRQSAAGDMPVSDGPTAMTANSVPQTLNASVLAQLRELEAAGAHGFLDRVVSAFVEDAGRYVAELKHAVDMADDDKARRLAHRLRGSSGSVGAQRVSDICALVEDAADLDDCRSLMRTLEVELSAATVALQCELPRPERLSASRHIG